MVAVAAKEYCPGSGANAPKHSMEDLLVDLSMPLPKTHWESFPVVPSAFQEAVSMHHHSTALLLISVSCP